MKQCFVFLFFSVALFSVGQKNEDSLRLNLLKKIVYTLANDSMRGRASGSPEEKKALNFICSTFKELTGKKLKTQTFSFYNDSLEFNCNNAFYYVNNHATQTLLISAHYDHIGLGGKLSMNFKNDQIHNGADDNASGVALLLSLSKELIDQKEARVNYLIVFYSGHELGLYGSSAFQNMIQKSNRYKKISTVINFDMIGRMDPTLKTIICMRSPPLDSLLKALPMDKFSFRLNISKEEKLKLLDTKTYVEAGIPCLNFTTGIHNDYHKTTDEAEYINYHSLVEIRKFVLFLLKTITEQYLISI
jgi:Zn-dependent M28 family amino/carboxypeptidase